MNQQIFLNGITVEDFQTQLIGKLKNEFFPSSPESVKETAENFLTAKQVSKLLGVSLVTLSKWRKDGKIKFHRFGSRIRFQKSEILSNEKFSERKK